MSLTVWVVWLLLAVLAGGLIGWGLRTWQQEREDARHVDALITPFLQTPQPRQETPGPPPPVEDDTLERELAALTYRLQVSEADKALGVVREQTLRNRLSMAHDDLSARESEALVDASRITELEQAASRLEALSQELETTRAALVMAAAQKPIRTWAWPNWGFLRSHPQTQTVKDETVIVPTLIVERAGLPSLEVFVSEADMGDENEMGAEWAPGEVSTTPLANAQVTQVLAGSTVTFGVHILNSSGTVIEG